MHIRSEYNKKINIASENHKITIKLSNIVVQIYYTVVQI